MFVDGFGLYRLDLGSGEISEIEKYSAAVSFSSDGRYLARFKPEENAIIVDNLETGKFSSFAIEFDVAGRFSWSPDESNLVFSAAHKDWPWHYSDKGFAVYLIDLHSLTLKLLVYQPPYYFTVDRWISDNEVLLVDDSMKSEGEYFILNVTTHELTPSNLDGIPLTPTP
jgi:Tol biopolymer transport system component